MLRDARAQDTVSEHPERFFVAEIIREKIFQQYREEVPYCTSVSVLALLTCTPSVSHLTVVEL